MTEHKHEEHKKDGQTGTETVTKETHTDHGHDKTHGDHKDHGHGGAEKLPGHEHGKNTDKA